KTSATGCSIQSAVGEEQAAIGIGAVAVGQAWIRAERSKIVKRGERSGIGEHGKHLAVPQTADTGRRAIKGVAQTDEAGGGRTRRDGGPAVVHLVEKLR